MKLTPEQQQLAVNHMRLVHGVIKKMKQQRRIEMAILPNEEAVGAGYLGLVQAASKWDPNRNIAFGTYAYRAIVNQIRNQALYEGVISSPTTVTHKIKNPKSVYVFTKQFSQIEKEGEPGIDKPCVSDSAHHIDVNDAIDRCLSMVKPAYQDMLRIMYWECDGNGRQTAIRMGKNRNVIYKMVEAAFSKIRNKVEV